MLCRGSFLGGRNGAGRCGQVGAGAQELPAGCLSGRLGAWGEGAGARAGPQEGAVWGARETRGRAGGTELTPLASVPGDEAHGSRKRRLFLCCAKVCVCVCVCVPAEEMIHTQVQRRGSEQAAQGLKEPRGGNGRGACHTQEGRGGPWKAPGRSPGRSAVGLLQSALFPGARGFPRAKGKKGRASGRVRVHAHACVRAHTRVHRAPLAFFHLPEYQKEFP